MEWNTKLSSEGGTVVVTNWQLRCPVQGTASMTRWLARWPVSVYILHGVRGSSPDTWRGVLLVTAHPGFPALAAARRTLSHKTDWLDLTWLLNSKREGAGTERGGAQGWWRIRTGGAVASQQRAIYCHASCWEPWPQLILPSSSPVVFAFNCHWTDKSHSFLWFNTLYSLLADSS